jgi:hypothetical protein
VMHARGGPLQRPTPARASDRLPLSLFKRFLIDPGART